MTPAFRTLVFALAAGALATASGCRCSSDPGSTSASATQDASSSVRPELVSFPSGALTLHGYLWKPAGAGPFPAVVFNHGSEEDPEAKQGQGKFYVPHGFVLFVPHRRGQGESRDAGAYVIDSVRAGEKTLVDGLVEQNDDVLAAIAYVHTLPFVDAARVSVAGCSFGGIETLLAAERANGIVAAIDFAGAAQAWSGDAALRDRMKLAARNAKVPVFFLQAENDYDTTPSRVLAEEMRSAGKPARIHIHPPNGTTAEEGHAFCLGGASPPWGDEVLDFLRDPARAAGE